MKSVILDFANMLSPSLGEYGLDPAALEGALSESFEKAYADVKERRLSGEMGFFALPEARGPATAIQELADGFGQWFENVVVL